MNYISLAKAWFLYILNLVPKGAPRLALVFSCLCVFFISLRYAPIFTSGAFVLSVFSIFFYKFAARVVVLFPTVNRWIIRKIWRLVRATRQFYKISTEVEFFYSLSLCIVIITYTYLIFTSNTVGYATLMYPTGFFLGVSASLDLYARTVWLLKKTWAKIIGKILLGGLGTVLVFIAAAAAKQTVRELTQTDPENFQEFVGALASIYAVLLWVLVVCAGVLALATIEFFCLTLFLGLGVPALSGIAESTFGKQSLLRLFYRMRTGKSAPIDYSPDLMDFRSFILFMRPLTHVMLMVYVFSFLTSTMDLIKLPPQKNWEKSMLLLMHYHPNVECTNIYQGAMIATLRDKSEVSVASLNKITTFNNKSCVRRINQVEQLLTPNFDR